MKKSNCILISLVLLAGMFCAAGASYALDAPHNPPMVVCNKCHFPYNNIPLYAQQAPPAGSTLLNELCIDCHNSDVGNDKVAKDESKYVQTHSSIATGLSGSDLVRNGSYLMECRACHNPHLQDQMRSNSGLGTLSSGLTSSITDTSLTDITQNWAPGQFSGAVLIPNTAYPAETYQIVNNDQQTLYTGITSTIGAINLKYAGVGKPYTIKYGKMIKRYVVTPRSGKRLVTFVSNSGPNSFASSTVLLNGYTTGVCQVCHTKTLGFRGNGAILDYGGHAGSSGSKCTGCHKHSNGFMGEVGSGVGCDSCHGDPPVGSTTLVYKSRTGATVSSDSPGAGAHQPHKDAGFICDNCHAGGMLQGGGAAGNDKTDIGFSLASVTTVGKYDGKSPRTTYPYLAQGLTTLTTAGSLNCTNLYCHSNVQSGVSGTYSAATSTPNWTNATSGQCGTCHLGDGANGDLSLISTGSHTKHVTLATYNYACDQCHNNAGTGHTNHVDNNIQVAFSGSGAYSQTTNTPKNGYGNCTANYCHSQGTASYQTPSLTPVWGTKSSGACGACHGSNHTTPPASSAHAKHVGSSAGNVYKYSCQKCHYDSVSSTPSSTTMPGLINLVTHVDGTRDVSLDTTTTLVGSGADYDGTSCSNVYCHSTGKPEVGIPIAQLPGAYNGSHYSTVSWADTLTCASCHGKTQNTGTYKGYPDYTMASQATDSGTVRANSHVRGATHNATSCGTCHYTATQNGTVISSSVHVNGAINVNFNTTVTGTQATYYTAATTTPNRTCSNVNGCHPAGTPSPSWGAAGDCTTCHNAGSTALAYAHSAHWATAAGDSTLHSLTGNGSQQNYYQFNCGVCHYYAPTPHYGATGAQLAGVDFNLDTISTPTNNGVYTASSTTFDSRGLKISLAGTCGTIYCHSSGIVSGITPTITYKANVQWSGTSTGCNFCHASGPATNAHGKHIVSYSSTIGCVECHQLTVNTNSAIADKSKHVDGANQVAWKSSGTNSTADPYNTAADSCTNLYCHSQGTAVYSAPISMAVWTNSASGACGACHGSNHTTPPASSAHAKHVGSSTGNVYKYSCQKCHSASVSSTPSSTTMPELINLATHVNSTREVSLDTSTNLVGSNATYTYSNTSCSNVYCHSTGKPAVGIAAAQLPGAYNGSHYSTVSWNATLNCASCHGKTQTGGAYKGYPDYTMASQATDSGTAKANSHANGGTHNNASCSECHYNTTQDGLTIASSVHVNGAINVNFSPARGGGAATYNTGTTPDRTCSNVTGCHSNSPSWGGAGGCTPATMPAARLLRMLTPRIGRLPPVIQARTALSPRRLSPRTINSSAASATLQRPIPTTERPASSLQA